MKPKAIQISLLAATGAASFLAPQVHAATYYWNNTTGIWATGANWSDNAVSGGTTGLVPVSTDRVVFNQSSINGNQIVELGATAPSAGITFNNTGTTTIQSSSTTSRNLSVGSSSGITINSGAGAVTIGSSSNPVVLVYTGAQSWSNHSSNLFTIAGNVTKGNALLTITGTGDTLIAGAISSNGGGLTKSSTGTLTLQGNNLHTGTTTVSGGGVLELDYSAGDASKLLDTSTLTLTRGTFRLKGDGVSHTEIISSTSLGAGASFITRSGTSNTAKLQMGAITRSSFGGTLSFGDASIATTNTNNVNSILGGWAIVANGGSYDWAKSVDTGASNTAITAFTGYTTLTEPVNAPTANHALNGSLSITGGGILVNSLKLGNSADNDILDLNGNNLTITSTSATQVGGILYTGGANGNYSINGAGRIVPSTDSQELIFAVTAGTLTVNAFVGASDPNTTNLNKYGAGTLVLTANNNPTGSIRIGEGALRLAHANGAGGNSANGIVTQKGAALELSGGITVANKALTIWGNGVSGGGALRNISGDNTYVGAIGFSGFGGSRINSDADTLTLTGGITTALNNHVTFGGSGNTNVSTTKITGAGNVIKDGNGTLILSAANDYTGSATISAGTLALGNNDVLPDSSPVSIGGATLDAATFTDTAGTLATTGSAVINIGSGAALVFADSSAITWTGTLNITGTLQPTSLRFGTTSAGLTSSQLSSISVNGSGTGTYTLDNNGYLVLAGGNTAPTISDIAAQSVPSGGSVGPQAFTINDAETAVGSLSLSVSGNTNSVLVPNGNITFGGSGGSRDVTVTPVSGLSGTAAITIRVTDGGGLFAEDSFILTVTDNYLSWATANSITGGPDGDSDNDGVKNLVEYALVDGGERGLLSGNTITFTKRAGVYGSDVTYGVETSTDLTSWTIPVSGVTDTPTAISYLFTPGTPLKNFARLKVVKNP